MAEIAESVGRGGVNKPVDVIKLRDLINNNARYTGLTEALPMAATADDVLIHAIEAFQSHHPALLAPAPDGRVDPGGRTLARLNEIDSYHSTLPKGFNATAFGRFDIDNFLALYQAQYPLPRLGAAAALGLKGLVGQLIADPDITDVGWAAYMLATVKHECANTWRPIEEYGQGAGRPYGQSVSVAGPGDARLSNVYYGRGYVQLTWDYNYRKMDTALGRTGEASLYLHPDQALDPDCAYALMSYGMRSGAFTGKKLADYIAGGRADYLGARRIINGQDQAALIQGYAQNIEFLLRLCNAQ